MKTKRLAKEQAKTNKVHTEFAAAFYTLIEKDLARGYDFFTTSEIPIMVPDGHIWANLLRNKCYKEDWVLRFNSEYSYFGFTLRHKKDHNWLTRLIKGWN